MTGTKVNFDKALTESVALRSNERSSIEFPYLDLDSAAEVATKLYGRAGISSCAVDELAAEMGQTTSSGGFRLKTSAAKTFGLIERDGQSTVKLSELGCRLVSPEGERDARADAFLAVPLYARIYEKYRGKLLPPTKALEREMQSLGVSSKQTDKARHAFQRSARQAGFFATGEDRLVRPRSEGSSSASAETLDQAAADRTEPRHEGFKRRGGGGGGDEGLHPFVEGLLQTMPEPGTVWSVEGQAAWLQAAANIFKLIYQGDGTITVLAKPE